MDVKKVQRVIDKINDNNKSYRRVKKVKPYTRNYGMRNK